VAVAAAVIYGHRILPGLIIASLFANLGVLYLSGYPLHEGTWASSLGVAMANTAEAALGGYLVRRYAGGRNPFRRSQQAFRFVLLGAILPAAVSATGGQAGRLWSLRLCLEELFQADHHIDDGCQVPMQV